MNDVFFIQKNKEYVIYVLRLLKGVYNYKILTLNNK